MGQCFCSNDFFFTDEMTSCKVLYILRGSDFIVKVVFLNQLAIRHEEVLRNPVREQTTLPTLLTTLGSLSGLEDPDFGVASPLAIVRSQGRFV